MDYCGTRSAKNGLKNDLPYAVGKGEALDVPVLDASRWVYECEVAQSVEIGLSTTFFCRIRNVQMDEYAYIRAKEKVEAAPAVAAEPARHGEWIEEIEQNVVTASGRDVHRWRCSACGFTVV